MRNGVYSIRQRGRGVAQQVLRHECKRCGYGKGICEGRQRKKNTIREGEGRGKGDGRNGRSEKLYRSEKQDQEGDGCCEC